MIATIKHIVRDTLFWVLAKVSPRALVKAKYYYTFRKRLNFDRPQNINEKINWMKFYADTSRWVDLADKYKVREYVKEKGLEDILVPLYGKWDAVEQIDWEALPAQFVMKTNHGSGDVYICHDKTQLDVASCSRYFKKQLRRKQSDFNAERHYDKIVPCIIAEQLLDSRKQAVSSTSLIDYKIWTFNGVPAYIIVCMNRTEHTCEFGVFDTEWNYHPEFTLQTEHALPLSQVLPSPSTLPRMLDVAARLSEGFSQVRIDLYEVKGKLYFGEMTFTAASGLMNHYSDEFLQRLGDKCVFIPQEILS